MPVFAMQHMPVSSGSQATEDMVPALPESGTAFGVGFYWAGVEVACT